MSESPLGGSIPFERSIVPIVQKEIPGPGSVPVENISPREVVEPDDYFDLETSKRISGFNKNVREIGGGPVDDEDVVDGEVLGEVTSDNSTGAQEIFPRPIQDNSSDNVRGPFRARRAQPSSSRDNEKKEETQSEINFREIQTRLRDPNLTTQDRQELVSKRDKIIHEVLEFNDGRFASGFKWRLIQVAKENDWDKAYGRIVETGINFDQDLQNKVGAKETWNGVLECAADAWGADAVIRGVDMKTANSPVDFDLEDWLNEKHYTDRELRNMARVAADRAVYVALGLPSSPEQLVGDDIQKSKEELRIIAERNDAIRMGEQQRIEEVQTRLVESQELQTEAATRQLSYQEQQIELMRRGLKNLIHAVVNRAAVDPGQYDQQLPPWFEDLPGTEQRMFTNLLNINYLAKIKQNSGMIQIDNWANTSGLTIEKSSLAELAKVFPETTIVLKTMVRDMFVSGQDHFVISPRGYAILGSEESLTAYREDLSMKIAAIIQTKHGDRLVEKYRGTTNRDIARLLVYGIDAFFSGTGVYDSADEARKINGNAKVVAEQLRAWMQPGVKAGKKFEGGEDFGGSLGRWMRENVAANRDGFGDRFRNGGIGFIPDRFYYSLPDMERFSDSAKWYSEMTLAQALLSGDGVSLGNGLYDFNKRTHDIDLNDLMAEELIGHYADARSSAIKLSKHLTGGKPDDRLNRDDLMGALIKVRGDELTAPIFNDEDLIVAMAALSISPNGFIMGTTEMVLNLPEDVYDTMVNNFVKEPRLYTGMRPGFRERLISRLNAKDFSNPLNEITESIPLFNTFFDRRAKLRRQADRNIRKTLKK